MKKFLLPLFSATVLMFISVLFLSFLCPGSFSQEVQKNQPAVSSKKTDSSQAKSNSLGSDAQGSAKIHFPVTSYDFGTVSQGEKVSYKFKVQNTGDAPLKLINAKGS